MELGTGGKGIRMEWKKGLCGICPAGCWVEIALESGRMVDIRPDDSHSLGTICRLGQHSVEIVYSEHRLKYPRRRIGPKGTYEFERISWNRAYEAIAENLYKIKAESGPEAVTVYTGRGAQELSLCDMFQPGGVTVSSASNVLFPFGSPNTTGVGALCYVSLNVIAPMVTMGRMGVNMFADVENSGMIVVWVLDSKDGKSRISRQMGWYDLECERTSTKRGSRSSTVPPTDPRTFRDDLVVRDSQAVTGPRLSEAALIPADHPATRPPVAGCGVRSPVLPEFPRRRAVRRPFTRRLVPAGIELLILDAGQLVGQPMRDLHLSEHHGEDQLAVALGQAELFGDLAGLD